MGHAYHGIRQAAFGSHGSQRHLLEPLAAVFSTPAIRRINAL